MAIFEQDPPIRANGRVFLRTLARHRATDARDGCLFWNYSIDYRRVSEAVWRAALADAQRIDAENFHEIPLDDGA